MENKEKARRKALKEKAKQLMKKDEVRRSRQAEWDRQYNEKYTPRMGQDRTSVILALGRPAAIDTSVTNKGKKEIMKYQPIGTNRYKLKIKLENGRVTGWESKG